MELLGQKTLRLAELQRMGLPVPPFIGISADEIKNKSLTELAEFIQKKLSCERYAVRSSALVEDQGKSSFAGQFLTELNVEPKNLAKALHRVLEDARKKLNGEMEEFSLLIQEFIDADYSGVTFTRDPLGGREMVIEFHKGLGEKLVGGHIKPKQIREYWTHPTHNTELPHRLKLIQNCKEIERHFASPQDIEWCIKSDQLYFLQSRPVTNLSEEQFEIFLDLDRELPQKKNFYFEKTEICEVAPRPSTATLKLLEKIYASDGPVQNVYKNHNIRFHPVDFFVRIRGELYIDKEKELKTLLPAFSTFSSHGLRTHWSQFKGTWISLKNIVAIHRLPVHKYKEHFAELRTAIEKINPDDFLKTYELIFEINLFASHALAQLKATLHSSDTPSISTLLGYGETLFPEIKDYNLELKEEGLYGNALDLDDWSPFKLTLDTQLKPHPSVTQWWKNLSPFKRKLYEKALVQALIYNRLRELARYLLVKSLAPLKGTKPTELTVHIVVLPKSLSNFFNFNKNQGLLGLSPGKAEGTLVGLEGLKTKGKKILYTRILSPDLVQFFPEIEGILSEEGGLLSHLAIVAREEGLPVISGFSLGTNKIALGSRVEIDGDTGKVKRL